MSQIQNLWTAIYRINLSKQHKFLKYDKSKTFSEILPGSYDREFNKNFDLFMETYAPENYFDSYLSYSYDYSNHHPIKNFQNSDLKRIYYELFFTTYNYISKNTYDIDLIEKKLFNIHELVYRFTEIFYYKEYKNTGPTGTKNYVNLIWKNQFNELSKIQPSGKIKNIDDEINKITKRNFNNINSELDVFLDIYIDDEYYHNDFIDLNIFDITIYSYTCVSLIILNESMYEKNGIFKNFIRSDYNKKTIEKNIETFQKLTTDLFYCYNLLKQKTINLKLFENSLNKLSENKIVVPSFLYQILNNIHNRNNNNNFWLPNKFF